MTDKSGRFFGLVPDFKTRKVKMKTTDKERVEESGVTESICLHCEIPYSVLSDGCVRCAEHKTITFIDEEAPVYTKILDVYYHCKKHSFGTYEHNYCPFCKCDQLEAEVKRLEEALEAFKRGTRFLLDEPFGCPACHSGKLVNEIKDHWEPCGFALLQKALSEN